MGRVSGKVALVSGASSGIGAACARLLAAEGAAVMMIDRNEALGHSVLAEIRDAGGTAEFVRHDVTDEPGWITLMDTIRNRFHGLNIAVNCAGTTLDRSIDPAEQTLEEWRQVNSVNMEGVFLATKHELRLMKEGALVNGSIVNMSSVLGIVGQPGIAAYNASKAGVRLYSKSVALSCAKQRIKVRVNTVHPGFIRTPMLNQSLKRFADPLEGKAFYDNLQPIGHLGEAEDIAMGVLYLASDEARFVTGAELVIDGGYTAQ